MQGAALFFLFFPFYNYFPFKVANKLAPGAVAKVNPGKLPFHRLENISNFLAWVRSLGIEDRNSFVSVDLHDEKDLKAVLICLLNLKRKTGYGNWEQKPKVCC